MQQHSMRIRKKKPDKMTEWPWLMTVILALISTVQWTNSLAQKLNYKQEEHFSTPKNYNSSNIPEDRTLMTTSRSIEYQSIGYQVKIKNPNISTGSNRTSYLLKNEYSTNNSNTQLSNNKKLSQIKPSPIIVFPNSIDITKNSEISMNKFIPQQHVIEKCSKNESFCTKIDNYPRQEMLRILRTSKFMSSTFFGVETMNDVETRFSDTLQPFCESKEEIIFPEISENKNNEWRYIIQDTNVDSNLRQGIRVEKCVNADGACKFDDHLPIGYTTTCVQKYMYKKLVAIKDSNEIYYDSFKLPSCCMCMYSVNSELLTRKGMEDQTATKSNPDRLKKN